MARKRKSKSKFGSCCGMKAGYGKRKKRSYGRRKRRFSRKHRKNRKFGAFTGGSPHSLLQMQGPYGASSYGRRKRKSRFDAFTGGSPHSLLQMQGPYGASSYGRRKRRFSRRFGAFTGGSPHSLLQMQGPYGASSYGKKKSKKYGKKHKKSKSKSKKTKKKKFGRRYSGMHHRAYGKVVGAGYKGQTTYQNVSAPYFGAKEPWVNASGWWYPITGGEVQSPQMLMK